MKPAHLDIAIWALIYAGLGALCLALFIAREGGRGLATLLGGVALLAVIAGAVLIHVRSRMH